MYSKPVPIRDRSLIEYDLVGGVSKLEGGHCFAVWESF